MRVKWNTKWREASCVHVALSVKVVVTTSFPLYLSPRPTSLVIYTFLFVSSTPHTIHPPYLPPVLHPFAAWPSMARAVCPVPGPFTFTFLYAGWAAPSPHGGQYSKEGTRERHKEREREREREKGEGREREILKRHKGRPHALKGNNSFTTEADSTWSDVWKFVCLLATRPINFFSPTFSPPFLFPLLFFFFFFFFEASVVRITFVSSNGRTTRL